MSIYGMSDSEPIAHFIMVDGGACAFSWGGALRLMGAMGTLTLDG